ncbi:MAG: CARDB domain-containing protein [Candidatus Micrarchaeia archaeon]
MVPMRYFAVLALLVAFAACVGAPGQAPVLPGPGSASAPSAAQQQPAPSAPAEEPGPAAPPAAAPPNETASPPGEGVADLQLSSLEIQGEISAGERVHGTVTTYNAGSGKSPATKTAYYVDSKLEGEVDVPPLEPGGFSTGNVTFICEAAGGHTISAKADSEGKVPESNERNNSMGLTFGCSGNGSLAGPADSIAASMADSSGNLYAIVMANLGVQLDGLGN